MNLAIVSHTRHYYASDGTLQGWGPTIREINFLADHFSEIIHVACLHPGLPPPSSLPYTSRNIRFVPIPPSGGSGFKNKLAAFTAARTVIRQVRLALDQADAVQLRVPTGIANYLLPWLSVQPRRPLTWVKYAGNWGQHDAPAGYRFQRWWLQRNWLGAKVTINGRWPDQPAHCISFENPCLEHAERMDGRRVVETKQYHGPFTACFIGRLETPKGVRRILDALPVFAERGIRTIHLVGDGRERASFEQAADASAAGVRCHFHGSLSRERIPALLAGAHFLLLPSTASEGFPKVIAEGANYGAIPLVSDVSGVSQYVQPSCGFLWNTQTPFAAWLQSLDLEPARLSGMAKSAWDMAEAFTFERYLQKLRSEILNDLQPGESLT